MQAADIVWRQDEKRLVVGMRRLDWEQTLAGEAAPRRLIAALRFDRVLACKSRNIDLAMPEAAIELVGIEFHPGVAPGGSAVLLFAQGAALRLDVECLECELTDLGTDDLGRLKRARNRWGWGCEGAGVIPGHRAAMNPESSRFRVWSFGPSRNDGEPQHTAPRVDGDLPPRH